MHIVYSAFQKQTNPRKSAISSTEMQQRITAYQSACSKYRQEIVAIQKYLPGWLPAFDSKG